jgi:hypothetical protein
MNENFNGMVHLFFNFNRLPKSHKAASDAPSLTRNSGKTSTKCCHLWSDFFPIVSKSKNKLATAEHQIVFLSAAMDNRPMT